MQIIFLCTYQSATLKGGGFDTIKIQGNISEEIHELCVSFFCTFGALSYKLMSKIQ